MRARRQRGFTLIEMMVALVAAGLLMASLVGLSASVQRSFGYSKDITELQGNLRFAMKTLVDDIARVSYMTSPDPDSDCHRYGPSPGGLRALEYDGAVLSLRGNFVSARDYLVDILTLNRVLCRNGVADDVILDTMDGPCGKYEPYLLPFADGPDNAADVFCAEQWVRVEVSKGRFQYLQVGAADAASDGLTLDLTNYSFDENPGEQHFVSPVTLVQYFQEQDAAYVAPFLAPTAAGQRWRLMRQYQGCDRGALTWNAPIELAEFLLPPDPVLPSGFNLEYVEDINPANFPNPNQCPRNDSVPQLTPWAPLNAAGQLSPMARGMTITLRGRTLAEDPAYSLPGLAGNPGVWLNYGVDLDGQPDNGLAYVRVERTVIQLRNLSLNQAL